MDLVPPVRYTLARGNPGDREHARDLAAAAHELALELDSPNLAGQASQLLTERDAEPLNY